MTTTPKETYHVEIINSSSNRWYNIGETYEVTKDANSRYWRVDDFRAIYVSDTKIIPKEEQMTTTETNEKPLADGWIKHNSKVCPIPPDTLIEVKYFNGKVSGPDEAKEWEWEKGLAEYTISFYRVIPSKTNENTLYICADSRGNVGNVSKSLAEAMDSYANEIGKLDFKDYKLYKLTPVNVELKEV